jgi:hypothetical protein
MEDALIRFLVGLVAAGLVASGCGGETTASPDAGAGGEGRGGDAGPSGGGTSEDAGAGADADLEPADQGASGPELRAPVPDAPFGGLRWTLLIQGEGPFLGRTAIPRPAGGYVVLETGGTSIVGDDGVARELEYGAGPRVLGLRADGHLDWQVVVAAQYVAALSPTPTGAQLTFQTADALTAVVDATGTLTQVESPGFGAYAAVELDFDGRLLGASPVEGEPTPIGSPPLPDTIRVVEDPQSTDLTTIRTRDGGSAGHLCVEGPLAIDLADGTSRILEPAADVLACAIYRASADGRVTWARQTSLENYRTVNLRPDLAEARDGDLLVTLGRGIHGERTWQVEVSAGRVEALSVEHGVLMRWSSEGDLLWKRGWTASDNDIFAYGGEAVVGESATGEIWVLGDTPLTLTLDGPTPEPLQLPRVSDGYRPFLAAFDAEGAPLRFARVEVGAERVRYGLRRMIGIDDGIIVAVEFSEGPVVIGGQTREAPMGQQFSLIARVSLGDLETLPPEIPVQTDAGAPCGLTAGLCETGLACVAEACTACLQDFHCAPGERCNGERCWPFEGLPGEPGEQPWGEPCHTDGVGGCAPWLVCHPDFHRCAECVNDGDCEMGRCAEGRCQG